MQKAPIAWQAKPHPPKRARPYLEGALRRVEVKKRTHRPERPVGVAEGRAEAREPTVERRGKALEADPEPLFKHPERRQRDHGLTVGSINHAWGVGQWGDMGSVG